MHIITDCPFVDVSDCPFVDVSVRLSIPYHAVRRQPVYSLGVPAHTTPAQRCTRFHAQETQGAIAVHTMISRVGMWA